MPPNFAGQNLIFPPEREMVGVAGFEPATLRLSSACSDQLSYTPGTQVLAISRAACSSLVAKIEWCDYVLELFDRNDETFRSRVSP